jgi:anaerobic selenocysteine-containing dehydrogenase
MADALHGTWQGGRIHPKQWNAMLMVGGNPIVSKQHLLDNPAAHLKQFQREGIQLIVIDPRRTETAERAALHLQIIPGEDPTVLAGLIHLIFALAGVDEAFIRRHGEGATALRNAVAGFTPDYVASRAGLKKDDLVAAARILVGAQRGDTGLGVGPSMATRGTLSSYLVLCIQTLRGWWAREGDPVSRPKVLSPRRDWRAHANPPAPAWGFGVQTSVRGLQQTVAGMPTAALPELMMTDAPDRVRALFLHAGAYYSWPDTELAVKSLSQLDLMVVPDLELSATSMLADYVIATYHQLEVPAASSHSEMLSLFHPGYAWPEPYGFYRAAAVEPPEGADLMESWQIYYRVAQKLGLALSYSSFVSDGSPPLPFDMVHEPSIDDICELMCRGSAVPLSEVKKHPHGALFDDARDVVKGGDPACTVRLQLANPDMLVELAQVRAEDPLARRGTGDDYPFLLICRRMMNSTNSNPRPDGLVRTGFNPLWMHPDDMKNLGLNDADEVEIRSRGGVIVGFVEGDETMRPGTVGMTHGFGGRPNGPYDPRRDGSNVNMLLRWDDDPDPYHGMPRMSAVPVAIRVRVIA